MAFGNDNVSNTGNYEAFFKHYYDDDGVSNAIWFENKFQGLVPKFEGSTGDYFAHTILFGAGQGASASFSSAQTIAGLSGENAVQMLIPLLEDFRDATVSSKVLSQGNSDKGSFVKPVVEITDSQLQDFANSKSVQLYRSQTGVRGVIGSFTTLGSDTANSTVVLATVGDALNFEIGMCIQASNTTTGTTVRVNYNGNGVYLGRVDYLNGYLTAASTPAPLAASPGLSIAWTDTSNGITGVTVGDYLFRIADKNAVMFGMQDWIPASALSPSDSFNGINRSSNPVRLAGQYLNGTGGEEAEVLETAIAQVYTIGGTLTHFLEPPKHFANLSKALGAKAQLSNDVVSAKIGYKGIQVVGASGPVNVIPERACPATTIMGIKRDAWQLNSVKKFIRVWDEDGKVWLRSPTASGMEIRFYSFAQLVCRQPWHNINITVSA